MRRVPVNLLTANCPRPHQVERRREVNGDEEGTAGLDGIADRRRGQIDGREETLAYDEAAAFIDAQCRCRRVFDVAQQRASVDLRRVTREPKAHPVAVQQLQRILPPLEPWRGVATDERALARNDHEA